MRRRAGLTAALGVGCLAARPASGQVALPPRLARPEVQYRDYARWQAGRVTGELRAEQLAYWRDTLAGIPTLQLPTDRPRPWVQTLRGATLTVLLSPGSNQK